MSRSKREIFLASARRKTTESNLFMPLCYFDYFKAMPEYASLLFEPNPFTEERHPQELEFRTDFYRSIGATFMEWIAVQGFRTALDSSVSYNSVTENNHVISTYDTPVGSLREVSRIDYDAATSFVTEPLLKTPEDATIYKYIVEAENFIDGGEEPAKWLDLVDGHGIGCQVCGAVPFHTVLHQYGPEGILVSADDLPSPIVDLMDALHKRNLEVTTLLTKSAFQVIKFESLWDIGILSPDLLSRFYVPTLKEYTGILHDSGKITMDHLSAHQFSSMLPQLLECGIDFLYGAEVNAGNAVELRKTADSLEGKLLMCPGISAVTLWWKSDDEVTEECETIAEAFDGAPAVFGTSDAMVPGTDPRKLEIAASILAGSTAGNGDG